MEGNHCKLFLSIIVALTSIRIKIIDHKSLIKLYQVYNHRTSIIIGYRLLSSFVYTVQTQ